MTFVVAYLATALFFLAADAVALGRLVQPVFKRHLGPELREPFRLVPAAVFYLFFVGVLTYLVAVPALAEDWPLGRVALHAGLIGAAAYGTYEFTSFAVMVRWHWSMVAVDFVWGTALTTASVVFGVVATGALGF